MSCALKPKKSSMRLPFFWMCMLFILHCSLLAYLLTLLRRGYWPLHQFERFIHRYLKGESMSCLSLCLFILFTHHPAGVLFDLNGIKWVPYLPPCSNDMEGKLKSYIRILKIPYSQALHLSSFTLVKPSAKRLLIYNLGTRPFARHGAILSVHPHVYWQIVICNVVACTMGDRMDVNLCMWYVNILTQLFFFTPMCKCQRNGCYHFLPQLQCPNANKKLVSINMHLPTDPQSSQSLRMLVVSTHTPSQCPHSLHCPASK